jgi:30S ribosomal protein 3
VVQKVTPYLRLNIVWLNNKLGLSIDQINSKNIIPLTNYYFWPKNNAWDQINIELQAKPWIEKRERVRILNNITQTINCWKTNSKIKTITSSKLNFNEFELIDQT